MTLSIGDRLPEASFNVMTSNGPESRSTTEVFAGRRVMLFGVPGAFTPACHRNHMPGYLEHFDKFLKMGIEAVACVAVNDIFVLNHWAETSGAAGKIEMLSDGSAEFVRAAGLELDLTARGFGVRSQRFAMLVEDGVVQALKIEPVAGEVSESAAENMLAVV